MPQPGHRLIFIGLIPSARKLLARKLDDYCPRERPTAFDDFDVFVDADHVAAEAVEDLQVAGSFVLVVAVPIVDENLHDDERLGLGHERPPRLDVNDTQNVTTR